MGGNEKSPRAQARGALEAIRAGESVDDGIRVKAEIYAIAAYFIEKATRQALTWLDENQGKGMRQQVDRVEGSTIHSSVVPVENVSDFLSSRDIEIVLKGISELIEGLLHHHVKQLVNDRQIPIDKYFASEGVSRDEKALERMNLLLGKAEFREGEEDRRAGDFILGATRAPAVFIPAAYHAGLAAFSREFGRLPGADGELDELARKLTPILLRLAQFNIADIASFNDKYFIENARPDSVLFGTFDGAVRLERSGDGYKFSFSDVDRYEESKNIKEPTVGCPAVYAQPNSQNAIREMVDYATRLLKQSGLYAKS